MLTLRDDIYSAEELDALHAALAKACLSFGEDVCSECADCITCPYRHACDDLHRLVVYIYKEYTRKTRDNES